MEKELQKLTKNQLLELVECFEHYPAVTQKDDKQYIIAYLEDESCSINKDEIKQYILKNCLVEITQGNIHLYYEFMSDDEKTINKEAYQSNCSLRSKEIFRRLGVEVRNHLNDDDIYKLIDRSTSKGYYSSVYIFNNIDTLKPIDEYIQEIKQSEAYKSYIANAKKDL